MTKANSCTDRAKRDEIVQRLIRAARDLQQCHQWTVGLPKNYAGRGPGNALADALDELRGIGE